MVAWEKAELAVILKQDGEPIKGRLRAPTAPWGLEGHRPRESRDRPRAALTAGGLDESVSAA